MNSRRNLNAGFSVNNFVPLVMETLDMLLRKIDQLIEVTNTLQSSKSRVINLANSNQKPERRPQSQPSTSKKSTIHPESSKEQIEGLLLRLQQYREQNIIEDKILGEYSPIRVHSHYSEQNQFTELQERWENGLKRLEERCKIIEDDLGDVLVLCKDIIVEG